jgi:TorA maturation chaperone TorD
MATNSNGEVDPVCPEAKARGSMYGLLAAVYLHPPTEEMVWRTGARAFVEDLAALFSTSAACGLKDYAAVPDPKAVTPLLKQEFMDLFVVPAGRYVMPFEDVYRGTRRDGTQERGPLLGERAVAAKAVYREAGAQMGQACMELPTHIGVELSFMGFLCEMETAMMGKRGAARHPDQQQSTTVTGNIYRQYQQIFLREHLNSWFPQLNRAIQEKAKSNFYRAMAQLTEEFLAWDMSAPELSTISGASEQGRPSSPGLRTG